MEVASEPGASLLFPFTIMALLFTKEIFVMLFTFAMVYFQLAVYVANLSL